MGLWRQVIRRGIQMIYDRKDRDFWSIILKGDKILSDKEAEELKSVSKAIRNEMGFRYR